MKALAVALAVLLPACSSSSPHAAAGSGDAATDTAAPFDGGRETAADAGADAHADATELPDTANAADTAAVPDDVTSVDGGGGWATTAPPGAYMRCGHGSFTQADAKTACAVPSFALDQGQMAVRSCNAVTLSGGVWEVWCGSSSDAPYVRVRYEGVVAASGSINEVSGWIDANGGGSGMTGSGLIVIGSAPTDVVLQTLGNTQPAALGQGNLFLVGDAPGDGGGGLGVLSVVAGATVSWNASDGG
jgi:hypothetical protein